MIYLHSRNIYESNLIIVLGIILYELISGKLPNLTKIQPLADIVSEKDILSFDKLINNKTVCEESERFKSVTIMKNALENWLSTYNHKSSLQSKKLSSRAISFQDKFIERQNQFNEIKKREEDKEEKRKEIWFAKINPLIINIGLFFKEIVDSLQSQSEYVYWKKGDDFATNSVENFVNLSSQDKHNDLFIINKDQFKGSLCFAVIMDLYSPFNRNVKLFGIDEKYKIIPSGPIKTNVNNIYLRPLFILYTSSKAQS